MALPGITIGLVSQRALFSAARRYIISVMDTSTKVRDDSVTNQIHYFRDQSPTSVALPGTTIHYFIWLVTQRDDLVTNPIMYTKGMLRCIKLIKNVSNKI